MYAGYIEDKLAEQSYHIKLLKIGIENYKANWLGEKYFHNLRIENFRLMNDIMSNVRHSLDSETLNFMYHSVYGKAGFKESLELFANFIDGLEVNITTDFYGILNIVFSTTAEIIRDYELFKQQINDLVRELLFYKTINTRLGDYTLEFNLVNSIKNKLTVTSRNYRFFEIYEQAVEDMKTTNYWGSVGPLDSN